MSSICDINKLRSGLKIVQNGEPCVIVNSEHIKPGKCQSFNRVKYRQLISGKIFEKTFKSGDFVELADVDELSLMYLYNDGVYWYFMNTKNFEQIFVPFRIVKDNVKWLTVQSFYVLIFWNNNPIFLVPPHFVQLKVVDIHAAIKGDSISSSTKLAVLSTGAVVKVPLFIKLGEYIRVDTRSSEYVSRVK